MAPEEEIDDDLINRFMDKVSREGMQYLDNLLKTLELNKLEAQYQDPEGIPLFRKEYDELGFVTSYKFSTPEYAFSIPRPREHFEFHEIDAVMQRINDDNKTYEKFLSLLKTNIAESALVSILAQRGLVFDKGPIIEKQYDEEGFYTSSRLNARYGIEYKVMD